MEKLFTIHYSLFTKNRVSGLRIRDVEGAEGGASWNERRDSFDVWEGFV